jgi:hypothetical protein
MTRTAPGALVHGLALAVLATAFTAGSPDSAAAESPAPISGRAAAITGTAAGTIVYIANHNVWIARGDGSGARAVTTDGGPSSPYGSPSQSDAGTIVATNINRLVRMDQQGTVLNVIDPPSLPTSMGNNIDGTPVDAAISPDGSRIAYTFTKFNTEAGGYRSATGYTAADRLTDPAPLRSTFFWSPSWVGNGRTLQTGGNGSQVQIHDLGTEPVHWFDDEDIYDPSTDLGNTELSRDGRYLAAVRGFDDGASIYWYRVNGNATSGPPPGLPDPLCQIGPARGLTNPTWGPDSDSLAWQESDGIWTRSGAQNCSIPSALILPGGSEPDWSPAALSAPDPHKGHTLSNTVRPGIKGKARVGRVLKARVGTWSVPGLSYRFTWLRNGKAIKGPAGRKRSYRVVRADRGKRLAVRVTATRSGYAASAATSSAVRVKG